ncbi:quercetin dioxygenase-like cupin family protein [Sinorhizobium kostiense]|uniref:Quercetin dioxygenase-like cupin family protein n=1 Tax=Sinorhizobium kostiense TaxID=76747 RepID=A0ABS4QZB8_9HYPH|nr:cupin domain-containing protein [Sinorhizobium kostiense]MBP2235983.1 quercetin dioxygenase-like cupin family protein [Sinorhizobium kostiense]
MKRLSALSTSLALLGVTVAFAQDDPLPEGFETQPLIKTSVSRDDDPIVYPTGKPEVISVVGTLAKDGRTALHKHPVPVYVYVLEGEIELRTEGKEPHRYKAGEAFIETQNRKHQAFNVAGTPSKILAVFIGEQGKPTTVAAQ